MRTNFQLSHYKSQPKLDYHPNNNTTNYDNAMQSSIQSLVRTNRELQDRLNEQKSKNYDLMELKRRLQEEINRLQFQFQRIKSYQHIGNRQALIKTQHIVKQNQKIRMQADDYLQEIKRLRIQLREAISETHLLKTQKESLSKHNIALTQQIQHLSSQLKNNNNHVNVNHLYNNSQNDVKVQKIPTIRSNYLSPNKQYEPIVPSSPNIISPKSAHLSTIPSHHYHSPKYPQSYTYQQQPQQQQPQQLQQKYRSFNNNSIKYAQHPIKEISKEEETVVKKQIKDQVNTLRDQLVQQLLHKYYRKSIQIAKENKSNSLKLFMKEVEKNISVLHRMAINYLQARHSVLQTCNSGRKMVKQYTNSNDRWVNSVYQEVKKKVREQSGVAGLYLGLFRLLTLVEKVEQIDEQLLWSIKHTCLKLINRIRQCM